MILRDGADEITKGEALDEIWTLVPFVLEKPA